jgi:hypothetical protein
VKVRSTVMQCVTAAYVSPVLRTIDCGPQSAVSRATPSCAIVSVPAMVVALVIQLAAA